ncbi:MAG: UvrD-helicase domain-containing protein [bacterium]
MSACRSLRFIASAGTGKTHQVVSLYQSLLLGRPYPPDDAALPGSASGSIFDGLTRIPPERILMLTFTKNAAAEMRARVTEAIERELATGDPANEATCWSLLRRLSGATISTIHSFAQQILAAHTLQLGLSPTLTVLEEAEAEDLRTASIQAALKAALTDSESALARDLERLCDGRGLNGIEQGIRQLLRKGSAWGMDLEHADPASLVAEPQPPSVRLLQELLDQIQPAAGAYGGKTLQAMAHDLDAAIRRLGTNPSPHAIADAAGTLIPLTTRAWGSDESVKSLRARTQTTLRELAGYSDRLEGRRLLISLLTLARDCVGRIQDRKRDQGVLDFDDLLFKARDLIRAEPGCIPPIDVIIVDEAQDNSRLQNDLIRLVHAGTQASVVLCGDTKQTIYGWRGADPEGLPRFARELHLDAVPLRTSYRSQKGVLDWVNDLFAGVIMGPELYGDDETLQPCPAAQALAGPSVELLLPEWELFPAPDQSVTVGKKESQPRLTLNRNDLKKLADKGDSGEWAKALERSGQAMVLEARAVARRIRLLTTPRAGRAWHPRQVWDSTSQKWVPAPPVPYRFRDVLILLRAGTRQELYEQALQEEEIPFTTDGKGRGFFARQETLDVANLLAWLAFPGDRLAYIGFLRSPFVALSDSAIARLDPRFRPFDDVSGWTPVSLPASDGAGDSAVHLMRSDADAYRRAAPLLARLRALAGRVSAVDLVRQAVRLTGYDAILAGTFHGVQRLANLQKLLSWIQDRERSENLDLQTLAGRLSHEISGGRESPDAAVLDPNDDSVRINTIHAAKGLSSPVVIIPDLRRTGTPDRDWILLARDDSGETRGVTARLKLFGEDTDTESERVCEGFGDALDHNKADRDRESRRLFYVACTRARDLIILSGENPVTGGDETWRAWINRHLVQCAFDPNLVTLRAYGEVESAWRLSRPATATLPVAVTVAQLTAARVARPRSAAPEQYRFPVTALTQPSSPLDLAQVLVARPTEENETSMESADSSAGWTPPSLTASERTGFGTLAHRLMETLDYGSATPLETRIQRAVESAGAAAGDREQLRSRVGGAARTLAAMLEGVSPEDLIRELPFAARFEHDGASVIVDGKVDLLFRKAGVWHIVDYKFSDHSEGELIERYGFQLAVYLEALSTPLPGTTQRLPRFATTGPASFQLQVLGVDTRGRCRMAALPPSRPQDTAARLIQAARVLR